MEIPSSVTNIENDAFYGCSGLESIKVEKGNAKYDSRDNCNAIIETETNTLVVGCKNTTIPNGVTSIGNYAFRGCSGLTSVEIPSSVTSIGSNAFTRCSGLKEVTSYIEEPAAFGGFNGLTIYVPAGTTEKYVAAWGEGNTYVETGVVTGVREVAAKGEKGEKGRSEVYDLAGRKLKSVKRGVVVVDGKLMLVK